MAMAIRTVRNSDRLVLNQDKATRNRANAQAVRTPDRSSLSSVFGLLWLRSRSMRDCRHAGPGPYHADAKVGVQEAGSGCGAIAGRRVA